MLLFILKRVIYGIATLFAITTLTFFLLHSLPGDPMASEKAIPEAVRAELRAQYNLHKPLYVQYGYYLKNLVKGDLGVSMKIKGRKISKIIKDTFPYSLDLGLRAVIFAFIGGMTLGIIAGLNRGKKWDTISMILAILGVSVPSFILGGLFQWVVVKFDIGFLAVAGYENFGEKILPAIALGMFPLAIIARMMRASMIDVLGQEYIKTAKAKGLSPFKIIWKHCIRNAIMPIITYLGPLIAAVTTGSFVVENVFAVPGLGKYYVKSIYDSDYTVVLGITIFYAAILILMVVFVDVLYGFIDPRVRIGESKEG